MKIYIDTNVYLDYFLDRKKSKHAFRIFRKTINCNFQIVLSDHILEELTHFINYNEARFLFEILKHKVILLTCEEHDISEAKRLPTHYHDALHIVLAKKGEAELIVTSNLKDFESIFKSKRPEDL